MIEALSRWLEQLILLLVAASLVQMALPAGNLRRYVEVTLGLTVLAALVSPLFAWMGADLEGAIQEMMAEGLRELEESPIPEEAVSFDVARAARRVFAERLEAAVAEDIRSHFGLSVRVEVALAEEPPISDPAAQPEVSQVPVIERLRLYLEPSPRAQADPRSGLSSEAKGIRPIRIEPVAVTPADAPDPEERGWESEAGGGEAVSNPGEDTLAEIRTHLARHFGVPADRIEFPQFPPSGGRSRRAAWGGESR